MNAISSDPRYPGQHAAIHVLPDSVASKIAAGEVVERPASVVRELVDNAIDSGAKNVRIEIRGGGRDLIRVLDDGCGIQRDDLPRAFLRHATSKIASADDLWAITTLGFRGEALYSITAVSKLCVASRPRGAQAGYEMCLEGGRIVSQSTKGLPAGTTVTVRDLFFNLPARLKFLKSPPAEAAHIAGLVQQYALAHPGIRFTLTNENRITFQAPGGGELREAASCVYGPEAARVLLPVGLEPVEDSPTDLAEMEVYGYVSPPAMSRSNRSAMHFFINRRLIASRMLQYAVEEAYHSLLMVGRHPLCVINVRLDPSLVDVNVHPAKAEVKFRDERAVFTAVQRAVRSALVAHVPAPGFGSRGSQGWELQPKDALLQDTELQDAGNGGGDPEYGEKGIAGTAPPAQAALWSAPAASFGHQEPEPLPAPPPRSLPPLRVVGQVGGTYIIAEGPGGMYLVDQHAAHERVVYERLSKQLSSGQLAVQPLLQPFSIEMTARQRAEVEAVLPLCLDLGFEIEPFGDRTLLVRAVPVVYAESKRDMARDLLEMLDTVINGSAPERWREEMMITLACHSAVRAGKPLSLNEMRALLEQLELCAYPRSCAHGRPTMLHLSQQQLEREFGRRG